MDLAAHVPTFSTTPYGVFARISIINWRGLIVALLGWYEGEHRRGLVLSPCEHPLDPQHQLFDISVEVDVYLSKALFRLITFDDDDNTPTASAGWRDVYLAHRSSSSTLESSPIPEHWRTIQSSTLIAPSVFHKNASAVSS